MTDTTTRFGRKAEQAGQNIDALLGSFPALAAKAATQGVGDQLSRLADAVAEAEGRRKMFTDAAAIDARAKTVDEAARGLRALVASMLINGADDEWSGRGNDNRRARFAGTRAAAREILDTLNYGAL